MSLDVQCFAVGSLGTLKKQAKPVPTTSCQPLLHTEPPCCSCTAARLCPTTPVSSPLLPLALCTPCTHTLGMLQGEKGRVGACDAEEEEALVPSYFVAGFTQWPCCRVGPRSCHRVGPPARSPPAAPRSPSWPVPRSLSSPPPRLSWTPPSRARGIKRGGECSIIDACLAPPAPRPIPPVHCTPC